MTLPQVLVAIDRSVVPAFLSLRICPGFQALHLAPAAKQDFVPGLLLVPSEDISVSETYLDILDAECWRRNVDHLNVTRFPVVPEPESLSQQPAIVDISYSLSQHWIPELKAFQQELDLAMTLI